MKIKKKNKKKKSKQKTKTPPPKKKPKKRWCMVFLFKVGLSDGDQFRTDQLKKYVH